MQATCLKMLRALREASAQRRLSAAQESVLHCQYDTGHCLWTLSSRPCRSPLWTGCRRCTLVRAQVRVVRGGKERSISTYDLLVGDVLLVDTGDILPADGLLFESSNLRCPPSC